MKATIAAVYLAALAEGTATGGRAKPSTPGSKTPKPGGKSFTLHQIENKNFKGHDGAKALMHAHMKYAQKLPDEVSKAVQSNPDLRIKLTALTQEDGKTGTVQAKPAQHVDSEYSIIVDFGTPAQTIPLNLDTGSSDLWVFSTDTDPSSVQGQTLYRPDNSSTSKRLSGETWKILYGDMAGASGIVYTDKVQIGDTSVETQAIEAALQVSADIASDSFVSGIMGMANSAANTVRPTPQRTYIDNIKDELALPLFTANLRSRAPGNYNFGYVNKSEHTGDIMYTQIDLTSPFWKISSSGYWIGKDEHVHAIDSIVDTGTSLMLLPQSVVDNYYASINGSVLDPKLGMMLFPCDADVPDFWLSIGSYHGRLPAQYINYGPVNPKYCFGGIQTSRGLPFSVLGDVFLKAQFAVFDYGDAVVGLANKDLGL
ncbi:hypothetical protein QQS21_000527 [Conoideocrella luteorostrata]|uniref:Peptidase A1 domain-containing protein n=1 Tax=Conoideocrella luteorostrata TaxID=1105319 RepID=A0AAJ0D140_9HYPO|nr:hypothetical protein QQS21_000527 [Conoideocrella luteorostrata]